MAPKVYSYTPLQGLCWWTCSLECVPVTPLSYVLNAYILMVAARGRPIASWWECRPLYVCLGHLSFKASSCALFQGLSCRTCSIEHLPVNSLLWVSVCVVCVCRWIIVKKCVWYVWCVAASSQTTFPRKSNKRSVHLCMPASGKASTTRERRPWWTWRTR